ncbi:MAG: hypothetical protein IPP46_20635 [Bacteroidetes bacterium]|nr:hypothetical protein [Bacteroidota bacterium]
MSSTNDKTKDALDAISALRNPVVLPLLLKSIKTNQDISYEQLPVELKVSEEGIQSRHNFLHRKTGNNLPVYWENTIFNAGTMNGNIEKLHSMSMAYSTGVMVHCR